jgi:hypothetical protein
MREPLIAIVTSKTWIKRSALLAMCIPFVLSCATAKPCICPPAEVITVKVPVPVPCPPPPEIPAPTLQIVSLSANLTPWPDLLRAIIHDYAELQRAEAELRQIIEAYKPK